MTATTENSASDVRTSRQDWLDTALGLLIERGVDQVKILTVTQKLGASRSSFYWFFKNRDDLLAQLVAVWRDANIDSLLNKAAKSADGINGAVLNVFECWLDEGQFDPRLESAIRDWARHSADIRDAIRQADDARIEGLRAMFARHGYPSGEDFIRARTLFFSQIGYYAMAVTEDLQTRLSYLEHYLVCLTGVRASHDEIDAFRTKVLTVKRPKRPAH